MKKSFLPNVAELNVTKLGFDSLAELFNIEKVNRSIVFKHFEEGQAPNKYLKHMYKRLTIAARTDNYKKFDEIASVMLTKSISFRLVGLNKADPYWFTRTAGRFNRDWRALTRICNEFSTKIATTRFWIEKSNGKLRPLGVPDLENRAFNFMWSIIIDIQLQNADVLMSFQHGGRPRMGLKTCWNHIIEKVREKMYIYEFDLKGFFDNIDQSSIRDSLVFAGLPQHLIYRLMEMVTSAPKAYHSPPEPEGVKSPTRITELVKSQMKQANMLKAFLNNDFSDITSHLMPKQHEKVSIKISNNPTGQTYDVENGLGISGSGVPQGVSFSPMLACLGTHVWISPWIQEKHLVMYMDDGLLYGDTEEIVLKAVEELKENLKLMGVSIAENKSGWVRKGLEYKSLKFLGLEYNFEKDTIKGATRNGSNTEFPALDFIKVLKHNRLMGGYQSKPKDFDVIDMVLQEKYLEIGAKYGLLGCFISHAQSPWSDPKLRKLEIELGMERAIYRMNKPKALLWSFQDVIPFYPTDGAIFIASSVAVINTLARIKAISKLGNGASSSSTKVLVPSIEKEVAISIKSDYEFI